MTINEFLDKVPWSEMNKDNIQGWIRHSRTGECPICAVWGGDSDLADSIGTRRGRLSETDAERVIAATDNEKFPDQAITLRDQMLRRLEAAR